MGHPVRWSRPLIPLLLLLVLGVGCGGRPTPTPPPAPDAPHVSPSPKAEPKPSAPAEPAIPGAVGIMVENSPQARPQTGLEKADLVFESESEYGITRFLALFYRQGAKVVGPVRSARLPFVEMATPYRVPYAHAGGSLEALRTLRDQPAGLLNVDEIYTCGGCFWRSPERAAPHNLYTSTDLQVAHAKEVGFPLQPLQRFPEGEMAGGQPVVSIAFDWGESTQAVEWNWDGKRYLRSQSGFPHKMSDGTQLATDNLVLLFTRFVWRPEAQPTSGLYQIDVVGSGEGILYRNGKAWPIRWTKSSRTAHIQLSLPDGGPVRLMPNGQTWITYLKTPAHLRSGRLPQ
jgi:hypothetical protein